MQETQHELQSQSPTPIFQPGDHALDYQQAFQAARDDLDFFAGIALPEIYKYPFPPIYHQFWGSLVEILNRQRDFSQFCLGLPRGFGKTLVIKLLILYSVLYTDKRFILVLCENEDKGKSILADVSDMLSEPNIQAMFGDWRSSSESNTLTRKKFSFRGRDIILKCAGAGTGIRGISEKNRRPDFMIFDDIQSREDSESPVLSKQLETWMTGTAMKAKSPEGCTFLFVANMYPTKGSLLRKLRDNPNWVKFIVGGILSDGTSLWEELQPVKQLLREYQNDLSAGQPQVFFSEVLNDADASVNTAFDLSAIPAYPFTDQDYYSGAFVVIDPATDKANSDFVAIGGFIIIEGRPVARYITEERLSPGDTIREALKIALRIGASVIAIESTAYQYSLKYWTEVVFNQLGVHGIEIVDVYTGTMSKNSRILAMFKQLVPSTIDIATNNIPDIVLHPEVKAQVASAIVAFNPLKRDNVDNILDLLTYAPKVLESCAGIIAINDHLSSSLGDLELAPDTETSVF